MRKALTLGVVGVLVLAAILVVFMLPVASANGLENQYTIYVENADTGAIATASVDGRSLSTAEMLMLSFGGGIRKADFKPLAGFASAVPILSKNGNYNIWAVAKIKTTGTSAIASITDTSRVIFSGMPSNSFTGIVSPWSNYVPAIGWLKSIDGQSYVSCKAPSWNLNAETTIDQSTMCVDANPNGKFVSWKVPQAPTFYGPITGVQINGMVIQVVCDIDALDTSGAMINKMANSTLTISVTSWSEDAFSVSITNIGLGGPTRVMIAPEIVARVS